MFGSSLQNGHSVNSKLSKDGSFLQDAGLGHCRQTTDGLPACWASSWGALLPCLQIEDPLVQTLHINN